jgi:hypothetical protein
MTTSMGTGGVRDPLGPTPPEQASQSPSGATEQAKAAAGTAKEEGRHVADVTKNEEGNVVSEATTQARDLAGEMRNQVQEQATVQRDNVVRLLQQFSDELHQMATSADGNGVAAQLVGQVADRSDQVRGLVEGHEPGDLVQEVRRFAGRRPGAFLLGALAAGVAAGRLTRGAVAAHKDAPSSDEGGSVVAPVNAPPETGIGSPVPTGPAVDPVEPGYGAVPFPQRPGGAP